MNKREIVYIVIAGIIIALFSFIFGYASGRQSIKRENNTSPVEKSRIDTLYIETEVLKYKVKYLDSIKYEKVYEVRNIDDSSSVRLFYELCSK